MRVQRGAEPCWLGRGNQRAEQRKLWYRCCLLCIYMPVIDRPLADRTMIAGTFEAPLNQGNDDPVSDFLYTSNFALLGLHEAAGALNDPAIKAEEDKLSDYIIRLQARSTEHPDLDGAFFRAFDYKKWEAWASGAISLVVLVFRLLSLVFRLFSLVFSVVFQTRTLAGGRGRWRADGHSRGSRSHSECASSTQPCGIWVCRSSRQSRRTLT